MTKAFMNRVIKNGHVDTRKYRYIYEEGLFKHVISRLPIEKLGKISALHEWEEVKVIWEYKI